MRRHIREALTLQWAALCAVGFGWFFHVVFEPAAQTEDWQPAASCWVIVYLRDPDQCERVSMRSRQMNWMKGCSLDSSPASEPLKGHSCCHAVTWGWWNVRYQDDLKWRFLYIKSSNNMKRCWWDCGIICVYFKTPLVWLNVDCKSQKAPSVCVSMFVFSWLRSALTRDVVSLWSSRVLTCSIASIQPSDKHTDFLNPSVMYWGERRLGKQTVITTTQCVYSSRSSGLFPRLTPASVPPLPSVSQGTTSHMRYNINIITIIYMSEWYKNAPLYSYIRSSRL